MWIKTKDENFVNLDLTIALQYRENEKTWYLIENAGDGCGSWPISDEVLLKIIKNLTIID